MLPGGSFIIHQSGMMGRKPTVEDCITPFDQYWLPGDIVFIIDDEVEIAITSGGIIERENYAVKKIDGIFCWEFTYTFTEAEIDALLAEQEQEQEPSE